MTYNQLYQTQWMFGCLKDAMDWAQPDKNKNLSNFVSLLEDTSDLRHVVITDITKRYAWAY